MGAVKSETTAAADQDSSKISSKRMQDSESLKRREADVRKKASIPSIYEALINLYSAILIFLLHLVSVESLLGIALSVGLTYYSYYKTNDNASSWDGSAMDWVLLSFAVITPMSASISMVFSRRESAVRHLAEFRATLLELYNAHASWDWDKGGESPSGRMTKSDIDWLKHGDKVLAEMVSMCEELFRFLSLPQAARARHRITQTGKKEAKATLKVGSDLFNSALNRMGKLTLLCEVLKKAGLPPNEATRLRQWERIIVAQMEGLRMIKFYRSPQALRSFARLFSLFLPPFYAPFYAQMGRDLNSLGTGVAFSIFTSLALTSLFDSISQMEDPFVAHLTLDGIDVHQELVVAPNEQLVGMRKLFFNRAPDFSLEEILQRMDNEELERPRFLA